MGIGMMDSIISKEGHIDIDLEKGRLSSEVGSSGGLVFGPIRMMNQLCSDPVNRGIQSCNGSSKGGEGVGSTVNSSCGDGLDNVKEGEGRGGDVKIVKEKPKAMSAKKPPRPPRGLSLDSADQKLIRELHELAKLKHARVERMKALKKAREAKAASMKSQLFATLLTVLFALVLLFQGISSRTHSAANFQGSPISSGATDGSVFSLQQHADAVPSASYFNGPNHDSPRLVERVSGSEDREQVRSAVG